MFAVCLCTMLQLEIADMLSSLLPNFSWGPNFHNVPSTNCNVIMSDMG